MDGHIHRGRAGPDQPERGISIMDTPNAQGHEDSPIVLWQRGPSRLTLTIEGEEAKAIQIDRIEIENGNSHRIVISAPVSVLREMARELAKSLPRHEQPNLSGEHGRVSDAPTPNPNVG